VHAELAIGVELFFIKELIERGLVWKIGVQPA
jgi:hypothetical protein